MEYMTKELIKVISGIDKVSYSEGSIYFTLSDYPLELWFCPCSKNMYNIIHNKIKKVDEFVLWEWTYFKSDGEIYKWKVAEGSYFRV